MIRFWLPHTPFPRSHVRFAGCAVDCTRTRYAFRLLRLRLLRLRLRYVGLRLDLRLRCCSCRLRCTFRLLLHRFCVYVGCYFVVVTRYTLHWIRVAHTVTFPFTLRVALRSTLRYYTLCPRLRTRIRCLHVHVALQLLHTVVRLLFTDPHGYGCYVGWCVVVYVTLLLRCLLLPLLFRYVAFVALLPVRYVDFVVRWLQLRLLPFTLRCCARLRAAVHTLHVYVAHVVTLVTLIYVPVTALHARLLRDCRLRSAVLPFTLRLRLRRLRAFTAFVHAFTLRVYG